MKANSYVIQNVTHCIHSVKITMPKQTLPMIIRENDASRLLQLHMELKII
jgi:hypothetical protein